MKQFISNMMREKNDVSEQDSIASIIKAPDFDEAASNCDPEEAERRNLEIFKNLTFDQEGNPIQMHKPDIDKIVAQTVQPRYKVYRRRTPIDED